MKSVYDTLFYGALGKKGTFTIGGGESGNQRTIHLLEKNGMSIYKIPKPYPVKTLLGCAIYIFNLLHVIFHLTFLLIAHPRIKTVHISGFYLHLIYQEYFLILVANLFKKRCIYELRGGGLTEAYQARSALYRLFFKAAVNKASVVLCQGKTYVTFLKNISNTYVMYYPNYILNETLSKKPNNNRHKDSCVHLIYFGRIVTSKNVELLLFVCSKLITNQFQFDMEIIGTGNAAYVNQLKNKIKELELEDFVSIKDAMPLQSLTEKLQSKHFFLFPTREIREGHSNSLTQAMAMGVVPICSNKGFNAEIVGNSQLIISDYKAGLYADVIRQIWLRGKWEEYSMQVSSRIKNNYTEERAKNILLKAYNIPTACPESPVSVLHPF